MGVPKEIFFNCCEALAGRVRERGHTGRCWGAGVVGEKSAGDIKMTAGCVSAMLLL